ncbi:UNVERIFIED_CONTAM: hypothetical protein FKN15_045934 [Acipenser sinensis]
MQPPQSYSVGGQCSSGQLQGKPADIEKLKVPMFCYIAAIVEIFPPFVVDDTITILYVVEKRVPSFTPQLKDSAIPIPNAQVLLDRGSQNLLWRGRGQQPINIRLSVMAVTRRGLPSETTGAEALAKSCGDGDPHKRDESNALAVAGEQPWAAPYSI